MISRIEKFYKPDTTNNEEDVQQLSAAAKFYLKVAMPTPATPGFDLASGNAIKLLLTLRHLVAADKHWGEFEEIGAFAGLTNRTLASAFNELLALKWANGFSDLELGIRFTLLEPPAALSPQAEKRFAKTISKLRNRPDAQEQ